MIRYIKDKIKSIKDTKLYAREKNIPNWNTHLIFAISLTLITSMILSLLALNGLVILKNYFLLGLIKPVFSYIPLILTGLIMLNYGKYPIKFLIFFSSSIAKLLMKIISKGDMYVWKKTGKDSIFSNYIQKHQKLVNFIFFLPLIIELIWSILK